MAKKKPASAPKKAAKLSASTPVDAITHKDSRTNIPTRELAGFAAEDEKSPKTILYPRDPSLDPQLVWKGKDEQDRNPLEVPAVPVYIQEKIHPRAIIEDLMERAAAGKPKPRDLFSDFNGLNDFEKKVDFYHHDQHWSNRMILGNSLFVMTSLAEKERLKGRVQMIYMDPPYGIKFGSNWQVSTRKRNVKDAKVEDVTRQPEQIQAFRDTWALGIHSYLPYLRDRLVVARDLLTESGSVFVQIGEENAHLVRSVMDEVFDENFVSTIHFRSMNPLESGQIESVYDHIHWYAKQKLALKYRNLWTSKPLDPNEYVFREDRAEPSGFRKLTSEEAAHREHDDIAHTVFRRSDFRSSGYTPSCTFPIEIDGRCYTPASGKSWRTNPEGAARLKAASRLYARGGTVYYKLFFRDFGRKSLENTWTDTAAGFSEQKTYIVQTPTKVIERCLLMTTDPGDLVFDPTCGSGTTAYVAEQWGRRWITIDTSRVALALARTRLMAARFPYYLLADSPEGRKKESGILGAVAPDTAPANNDIRRGFVYKRVPHVTLKSIANNPDIKEGMTREDIDAAIRKHAETEILYDQPYDDKGVVRVTGPFTVESLSPHRMLPTAADSETAPPAAEVAAAVSSDYLTTILDNLRKAGVQNTVKNERLVFDRLDVFPGEYIQAEGTYSESGATKAVRVSVGPEFGTVGPEWVQKAALEAVKGSQCELVLVCGFAFDPHVSEQTQELKKEMRFGKVRILAVRMNPDLTMGDDLLKKTGGGNLFMVFGEPDIDLKKQKDGKLVAEIRGLDVYDPTTGAVRSHSTDDIACWFLDTDYNGESFFVRHAYFCGGDEPYEKLKKALRAEIDEAEWAKLYSTKSLPFDPPTKGKIAVKVINHYGDEVLKVFRVP